MPGKSAQRDRAALRPSLPASTPRAVGLSRDGVWALVATVVLVAIGVWGGTEVYARARAAERRVALFASAAVSTNADVVRVQRRGGGEDRRSVIHYRYRVDGRELQGQTTVRRRDRDAYPVGSSVVVRYLAPEPRSSWMEGYGPGRRSYWPALVLWTACTLASLGVAMLFRRQTNLLAYGRPAQAVVTKVEKKHSEHGGHSWRVDYQWRLLSGAICSGGYDYSHKVPPTVGMTIPVVYHRERPRRHSRYPVALVRLKVRADAHEGH